MKATISKKLQDFGEKISKDSIFTLGAALALYTVFALPPLVILLLKFLSSLKLSLQEPLIDQVRQLMGSDAATVFETVVKNSIEHSADSVSIWGVLALGISASVIFAQLQSSLNIIFESESVSKDVSIKEYVTQFISRRIICFGMVLTFIFISIVSLLVSGLLSLFTSSALEFWMRMVQLAGNLLAYSILFSIIIHWMPDTKVPWPAAIQGGAITALLFLEGKILIGVYLGHEAIGSAYGATGSLMIMLVWVYYSSIIVLFGAEISFYLTKNGKILIGAKA